jgi:hypothetical protein
MRKLLRRIIHILDGTPAEYGQHPERGQSLVEMAFIVPILIIMVVGLIEIGWYANNYINLIEAAKVGARRGPFLNGENAPQAFDPNTSVAPRRASAGYPALASPGEAGFNEDDPRNKARGIKTTTTPNTNICGIEGINVADFGFYNLIVCTVLASLDPLRIQIGTDPNGFAYKDDIVVSVFSLQHVNNAPGQALVGVDNPDTLGLNDPYDLVINTAQYNGYPDGHQVVVAGRWPPNANECAKAGINGARDPGDYRDPFDYIVNNTVDTQLFTLPNATQILIAYELAIPVYSATGVIDSYQSYADVLNDEIQRGWAYTGQHRIDPVDGFNETCWGSEFTLREVEDRLNLPNFIDPSDPQYQDRRAVMPSQGLVLVEVFWEHNLLLGEQIPVFNALYDILSDRDNPDGTNNVIRVWSAFPAAAAEPNIIYQPGD